MFSRVAWVPVLCAIGSAVPSSRSVAAPSTSIAWEHEGSGAFDFAGSAVGTAGDVNCDGYADLIIGVPNDDEATCPTCGSADSGTIEVFFGGPGRPPQPDPFARPDWYTYTGSFGGNLGSALAAGDGYGDVLVGAPYASSGPAGDGRVFLYLGAASGLSASHAWSKTGGQAGAHLGIALAGAGDVNGDGYSDVIIGADGYAGTGAAFVYLGQPGGLKPTAVRTYLGSFGSSFGLSVGTAGDVNHDGYADVVVGAPTFTPGRPGEDLHWGEVRVYHGSASGPGASPATTLYGDEPIAADYRFGSGVAGAGDVNGDGYGDLIVGDQWWTDAQFAQGKAYVFHGGPGGLSTAPARTLNDCPTGFCDFGRDVAGGHDVNGDGFSDVLIGAFGSNLGAGNGGDVFLHLGNEARGSALAPL